MEHSTLLAVGVWLGVLLAGALSPAPIGWALASLAALGIALALRRGLVVGVLGLCLGVLSTQIVSPGPVLRGPVAVHGRVVGAPVGGTVDLGVWRAGSPKGGFGERSGRVRLRLIDAAPPPGTEVLAWGEARPVEAEVLPGAPALVAGAGAARVRTEVKVREWVVIGGRASPSMPIPARHGGVLQSLALGDKRLLDPSVVASLRATGTSHLLAISGFHVGVVAGVSGGVVALLLRLLAVFWERGVSVRPAWIAAALSAWTYAILAGAPVSAQRAAGLVALAALVRVVGARPDPIPLLATVAALLLVVDPAAAFSPGFQLSFGAVVGLARFAPALEGVRPSWWPRWLGWAWTSLVLTLAATIGTLPAAGWWFQALAPTAPLANLVAVPLTTFVLAPLAALGTAGPSPLDGLAYRLADPVVDLLLWALSFFEAPAIPIAWGTAGALGLGLALVVHRRWAWALALALVLAPPPRPPKGLRVTWPEIGQGSAALVEWPDGRRWLVDGGPRETDVLHWLRRRGVRRLDVVVASHARPDHVGGLAAVVAALPVGEVWVPLEARGDHRLKPLVLAALQAEVPVIPGPPQEIGAEPRQWLAEPNDRSLVLAPSWQGRTVLLPSDLAEEGEAIVADLLSRQEVVAVAAPRHGGRGSSTEALIEATRPQVVVAQAGRRSRFGHPTPEVVERWSRAGARVFQTGRDGTIELTISADQLDLRTWRWDRGWRSELSLTLPPEPER